ncbi:MAG TPA: pyridoxal phosphate-dependent aminotransferase [Opitutales bacterium]|nr:pyridoxal phosphate-dependent aminotransferase [Opitutales bacterium]
MSDTVRNRPVRFARRTRWDLGENVLSAACRAAKASGRKLLDLSVSNPTRCAFDYSGFDLSRDFSSPENHCYNPDPWGLPAAREAISAMYAGAGLSAPVERLMLTSSTSEAYSHLFRLLADPGDEILSPAPSYPLFQYLADVGDVKAVPYALSCGERGWRIDRESLLAALSARTRAVIVVNPNNPTGSYVSADDFAFLCEVAEKRGLAILSDEVFSDYPIAPNPDALRSLAGRDGPLTFVLGGLSKLLAMPQMKLSWILAQGGGAALADACRRLEMISDTFLSVGTPVQNACPLWLPRRAAIQDQISRRIAANMAFLRADLAGKPGLTVLPCEGGWYAVVQMEGVADEDGFATSLLEAHGVVLHPGYYYDFVDGNAHAVLSLLTPEDSWRAGVAALAAHHEAVSVL